MIAPGAWLGLMGGGQLGRMFCMAAQSMGYRVAVLDPGAEGPAASVADRHIAADYLDPAGLNELARLCAAATTEFENVPAQALQFLAQHCRVTPEAEAVAIAQDRIREKRFLAENGAQVVPFQVIASEAEAAHADASLFPGILKTARLGYDGKGQSSVTEPSQTASAWRQLGATPAVLEKRVDLALEVSVVVARGLDGETRCFPVAENRHRDGILDISIVPARVPAALAERARALALRVAERLDYHGVLCVEMFLTRGGELLVNEIAPRPHNSGHYTIDACIASQFEQQARVMAGLPLGDPRQHTPAVMLNLLGDIWARGEPDWARLLGEGGAKLHLYGKREARAGRKMGHLTCLGDTLEEALATAARLRAELGLPCDPAL
jgi:5-(carboxyamino)imidazole ribonucleotide synthase